MGSARLILDGGIQDKTQSIACRASYKLHVAKFRQYVLTSVWNSVFVHAAARSTQRTTLTTLDLDRTHACIVHSGSTSPEYTVVSLSLRLYLVFSASSSGAMVSMIFASQTGVEEHRGAGNTKYTRASPVQNFVCICECLLVVLLLCRDDNASV